MNLVHALAETFQLLAIVGEPPRDLQGRGTFQDTSGRGGAVDTAQLFAQSPCSVRGWRRQSKSRRFSFFSRGCARRQPGAGGVA